MGKPKKHKNSPHKPRNLSGVRFEIESDADQLWQEYLDAIPNNISELKDDDADSVSSPKPRSAPRGLLFHLDLHSLTLVEAEAVTHQYIDSLLQGRHGVFTLKVITGRGVHSGYGGSVLVKEIYHFILATFRANIVKIDAPPAESTLDGLPLRGFFLVHFSTNKR